MNKIIGGIAIFFCLAFAFHGIKTIHAVQNASIAAGNVLDDGDGTYSFDGAVTMDSTLDVAGDVTVVDEVTTTGTIPRHYSLADAGETPRLTLGQGAVDGSANNNFGELIIDGDGASGGGTDDVVLRTYYASAYHTIVSNPIGEEGLVFGGYAQLKSTTTAGMEGTTPTAIGQAYILSTGLGIFVSSGINQGEFGYIALGNMPAP